jgi:hypothetical protein
MNKLIKSISSLTKNLNSNKEYDNLIKIIDDFPYKKNDMKEQDILKMFNNLKSYKPSFKKVNYRIKNIPNLTYIEKSYLPSRSPVIFKCSKDDYNNYNLISDYFTEECRIKAKKYDQSFSPYEYWHQNKELVKSTAMNKYDNLDNYSLRETLYELIPEVTQFRTNLIVGMIREYKPKKVLDFSSGWGDRLIGTMAADVDYYCGIEPNSCLHPKYKDIINKFKYLSKTKVDMIHSCCEDAQIPIDDFDMIFTSPPYFNLEIYSNEETQSVSKNKSLNDWYNNFLLYSIRKVWSHLSENGVMILIINDIRDKYKYVKRMISDINKFVDSMYLGLISYAEVSGDIIRSPQPMWIWRKKTLDKNPPVIMKSIEYNNNVFNLISDGFLPGGTKQRAWQMFTNVKEDELVYAGPSNGFAQVALAISAKLHNKNFTMFLSNVSKITNRARMYGANIIILYKTPLKLLQRKATDYAKKNNSYLVPFGLDTTSFKENLYNQLSNNIKLDTTKKYNIWLVGGSATLVNVLYKLFPNSNFNLVQVGKKIWPDQVNKKTKIYIAPEKFWEATKMLPPYPSVSNYDAKVWQFVSKYGKNNDIIWNVAAI